ncbi:MAG: acetate--CoA ligase family protein [Halobacteriota archaeon]
MGDTALDSLLSPNRVSVVGPDDPAVAASAIGESKTFDPKTLAEIGRHDWFVGTDLAIVTTTTGIESTVATLVDNDVGSVLVTVPVEDPRWFELVEVATAGDVDLIGPDAALVVPDLGLQANVDDAVESGAIALVGEDPQTIRSLVAEATHREIGFSTVLATGRHATVRPADAIAAFEADEDTSVVLARPERIDRSFYQAASTLSSGMALVVHAPKWACVDEPIDAGSLGTIDPADVRNAVLEQAGVLRVDSVDRLLDLAPALAEQPLPAGDDVVIVSNAGGPGVMATDAVGVSRLSMAELSEETVERLEAAIPDRAYARNPLDLLADSDIDVFSDVLDAVLTDQDVDAAVVISAPNPLFTFEEMAENVASARSEHESPVVTALMGGESTQAAASRLRAVGIPNYFDPFQAVAVLSALADQRDAATRRETEPASSAPIPVGEVSTAIDAGDGARAVLAAAGLTGDRPENGVDVSVVARDLPHVGPVVAVGIAEYAAVLNDVALRVSPTSEDEVRSMFDDLRASQLLKGARGTEAVDVDTLVDAVLRIAAIPVAFSAVDTVDATVRASESGVGVTDASLDLGDHQ